MRAWDGTAYTEKIRSVLLFRRPRIRLHDKAEPSISYGQKPKVSFSVISVIPS